MIKLYREGNITIVSTHNACFHHDIVIVSVGMYTADNKSFKKRDAPKRNFS